MHKQQAAAWGPVTGHYDVIEDDDLLLTAHLCGRNVAAAGAAIVVRAAECGPVSMLIAHCGSRLLELGLITVVQEKVRSETLSVPRRSWS